jgi:hypothetical protein
VSQFFSAWVTETETIWSDAFKRKDLDIATLQCQQNENECATLTVTVRNEQIGLLAPGRLVWLWLAWENDSGTTIPIFFGRLVPVPNRSTNQGQGATLTFIARPLDFDIQRVNVALALQIAPYYDPVFIDPAKRLTPVSALGYGGDPDTVLEGWARLWSIDRVTGQVDTSDVLEGEDGVEIFNSVEIPEASIQINTASSVLADVTVVGTVNWTQSGGGGSFSVSIAATAPNGLDLISGWPKGGSTLGGGYEVISATTVDYESLATAQVQQKGWRYENKAKQHNNGDVISISWNYAAFPPGLGGNSYLLSQTVTGSFNMSDWTSIDPVAEQITADFGQDTPNPPYHVTYNIMVIADVPMSATMQLGPSAKLSRNETLSIKLSADIQRMITIPSSAATPSAASPVTVSGSDVGVPIEGITPISGNLASNYFPSDRGQQSIDYLVSIGVAHLKSGNRAVTISWDTTFERALALSCRKNATINARTVPGGSATGKITAYNFSASGVDLQLKGNVTIGCCIGNGGTGTVGGSTGTDALAVPGTFVDGVAVHSGVSNVPGANTASLGDVSYTPPIYVPAHGEPIFPLQASQCIVNQFFSTETAPVLIGHAVNPVDGSEGAPINVDVPIQIFNLELLNLNGSFASTYDLSSTPVKLPKQIDLTVPSW